MASGPRTVITGAAGFLGSHLTDALLARGHEVIGVDNLITGDEANIAHLAGKPFTFIRQDITTPLAIDGAVDYVLNWASPASPIDYLELPFETLDVGSTGTKNALELARAKGAVFMTASTVHLQALEATNVDEVLRKPVTIDKLFAVVHRYVPKAS